jgi:hypothetical protein
MILSNKIGNIINNIFNETDRLPMKLITVTNEMEAACEKKHNDDNDFFVLYSQCIRIG